MNQVSFFQFKAGWSLIEVECVLSNETWLNLVFLGIQNDSKVKHCVKLELTWLYLVLLGFDGGYWWRARLLGTDCGQRFAAVDSVLTNKLDHDDRP